MVQYEMNLQKLCQQLERLLEPETLLMWTTSMPVSQSIRGGFLIDEISFMSEVLRVDVLSANYYASQVSWHHIATRSFLCFIFCSMCTVEQHFSVE